MHATQLTIPKFLPKNRHKRLTHQSAEQKYHMKPTISSDISLIFALWGIFRSLH